MLTVSETRSPHQRKSAVRARPGKHLRVRGKHLRVALVRHDQKLIVAPAPHLLGRPQALRQRVPHLFEHGVAGCDAMRLAQFLRLVHADPQNAKGRPAAGKIVKLHLQPFLELFLAAFKSSAEPSPVSPCGSASKLCAG